MRWRLYALLTALCITVAAGVSLLVLRRNGDFEGWDVRENAIHPLVQRAADGKEAGIHVIVRFGNKLRRLVVSDRIRTGNQGSLEVDIVDVDKKEKRSVTVEEKEQAQ